VTALLKQAGYATAHFGKWHLGGGPGAPGPDAYGINDSRTVNANGPGWEEQGDPRFRAKSTTLIVDETLRFIKANRDKPFYVNVWTLVPHAPLNPTEEQMEPYARFGPGKGIPYKGAMQIYYATVTDLDTQVGRLMTELEKMGLAENTFILFSSDNGPEDIHISNASHSGVGSAGPFRGRKRSLYEGGIRMPCIVQWPGHVPANRVDETSVLTGVDFLPTVCALAGVKVPDDLQPDGEDVSDILLGASRPRQKPIMWEWRFNIAGDFINKSPMLAVREGQWKLLMNPDGGRKELYDIPADPMQLNNQADRHPEIVERLSQNLLAWQKTLPKGRVDPSAGKNDYPWPGSRARQ
jgi:N-acetylgalactosamine-6-sulfatase